MADAVGGAARAELAESKKRNAANLGLFSGTMGAVADDILPELAQFSAQVSWG